MRSPQVTARAMFANVLGLTLGRAQECPTMANVVGPLLHQVAAHGQDVPGKWHSRAMPPRLPSHHRLPSSAVAGFIDPRALGELVGPLVGKTGGVDFLVRCLVGEGPVHHRGANWVLLTLLGQAAKAAGATLAPPAETLDVPLRLPPHLTHDEDEQNYPLGLTLKPLERLANRNSREFEAMVDCLTDGPPQHVVANMAMVALLGALLDALEQA